MTHRPLPFHRTDADSLCVEQCPHPTHNGPVLIAIPNTFKPILDQLLADMDLAATFLPSEHDDFGGLRAFTVAIPEDHPLSQPSAIANRFSAGPGPRVGKAMKR